MNKAKLLILVGAAALLLVGVFLWFKSATPSDLNVKIVVFNNDLLLNDSSTIRYVADFTQKVHEYIVKANPLSVSLELFGSAGVYKPKMLIKRKPGERDFEWEKEILDSVRSLFTFPVRVTLANNEVNELFITFLRKSLEEPDAILIFAGSFPECYDHTSKMNLVQSVNSVLEKYRRRAEILNGIIDCRKGLEADVFDTLSARKNIRVETMNLPKITTRICEEKDLPVVYGMFFDSVKENDFEACLKYIQDNVGKKFVFTIWNSGPKNDYTIRFLNTTRDSVELKQQVAALERVKWSSSSIGFLFKHCYNTISNLPDSQKKYVFMIGHFPAYGSIPVLDREVFWPRLQKVKNVRYYHFVQNPNDKDREYIDALIHDKKIPVETSYQLVSR